MKIYEFLYCCCVHESSYQTMSFHRTKAGAYRAMNKYINEKFMEEYDERIKHGKGEAIFRAWKVGAHEAWCINERELLD